MVFADNIPVRALNTMVFTDSIPVMKKRKCVTLEIN